MILETIENSIEETEKDIYKIIYISLSPNDYVQLGNELREISSRNFEGQIKKLHSIPVYMDTTQDSHLVMALTNFIERKFLSPKKSDKK